MATKDTITEDDEVSNHEKVEIELTPEEQKQFEAEEAKRAESLRTDDEEDDDIEPEHPDADDAERADIRARRRQEKLERKERRDQAIKRDKLELEFLRKQNEQLEKRMAGVETRTKQADLQGLDAQLKQAVHEMEMAEQVIAKAVSAGNGDDVARAMKYRDQAIGRAQQLNAIKQAETQRQQAPVQPAMDERVLNHAQAFLKDHTWYDPQGRDEDSAIVMAIDQAMAKEGWDPKSDEYWTELRKRTERRLPDKFKPAEAARSPRGGPAVGSGKEHAPISTRKEVYLSPERKQALIEAGVWDDPVLRQKYARRYAEYDRANRA